MIPKISNINFQGRYLVQVPKNTFKEPENLPKCEDDFENLFAGTLYQNTNIFQRRNKKFYAFLEAPMYPDVMKASEFPIHWINIHTGINIAPPKSPDYHSFVVITKKEADKMAESIKPKKLKAIEDKINKEETERMDKGLIVDKVWQTARAYQAFNEVLDGCTDKTKPDEIIILNSLDDIPYAISEMDV